jgi:outer membrane protein, multidrug efflux system
MSCSFTTAMTAVTVLAAVLAGCAVGPDYRRPPVDTPPTFRGGPDPAVTASVADLPWWEVFQDAVLAGLIREALERNYDLRVAAARVKEARALAAVTRAQFFPWIRYQAAVQRARGVFKFIPELELPTDGTQDVFLAGLMASWELDVWGRIRRATESAEAQLLATDEGRRAVLLSLVSEVAQRYFDLLELDLRLEIARSTSEAMERTYRLFRRRLEFGVASTLQTSRAEGAWASAAATIPDLDRQRVAKENEISLLLGRPPGLIPRGRALVDQPMLPEIPAGLPSTLLERRPDLLEAEQMMVRANALVGVAKANFFPRIGLTTLLGAVSPELSALTGGAASVWVAAASLVGPIFQGGRILAGYRASVAAWEQARLHYERAVITALQEVSDTLTALERLADVEREQARAVKALEQSVVVANRRYLGGFASYYEVLEAQQLLFPAQNALAQVRRDRLLAYVRLYKVLGGGWNLSDPQWAEPAASP